MNRVIRFPCMYSMLMCPQPSPIWVKLEDRMEKYMFGSKNYGEIPGFINPADRDAWDIIVPGYRHMPTNVPYIFDKLIGIFLLPNGNHKLIIDIKDNNQYKENRNVIDEMRMYQRKYQDFTKLRGRLIFIH